MTDKKVPIHLPLLLLWFQIKQFWFGRKSLAAAFWGVGVGGMVALLLLLVFIVKNVDQNPWLIVFAPLLPAHIVFSLKSIWACSPNVKTKAFGDIARLLVIAYVGFILLGLIGLR